MISCLASGLEKPQSSHLPPTSCICQRMLFGRIFLYSSSITRPFDRSRELSAFSEKIPFFRQPHRRWSKKFKGRIILGKKLGCRHPAIKQVRDMFQMSCSWDYGKSPYAAFFLTRRYDFRKPPRRVNMTTSPSSSCGHGFIIAPPSPECGLS